MNGARSFTRPLIIAVLIAIAIFILLPIIAAKLLFPLLVIGLIAGVIWLWMKS